MPKVGAQRPLPGTGSVPARRREATFQGRKTSQGLNLQTRPGIETATAVCSCTIGCVQQRVWEAPAPAAPPAASQLQRHTPWGVRTVRAGRLSASLENGDWGRRMSDDAYIEACAHLPLRLHTGLELRCCRRRGRDSVWNQRLRQRGAASDKAVCVGTSSCCRVGSLQEKGHPLASSSSSRAQRSLISGLETAIGSRQTSCDAALCKQRQQLHHRRDWLPCWCMECAALTVLGRQPG